MLKFLNSRTIEDLKDESTQEDLKQVFAIAGRLTGSLIVSYIASGAPPQFIGSLFKDVPSSILHTLLNLPADQASQCAAEKLAEEYAMTEYLTNLQKKDFSGSC